MKKGLILSGLALMSVILFIPFISEGAVVGFGDNYIVPKDSRVDTNLYAGGQQLTLTGNIFGDVVGGGGNVFISNKIAGDALLFGGTINTVSNISGDLRLVGMSIVVSGEIDGDVAVAGKNIRIVDSAFITGDLLGVGGNIVVSGPVKGSVKISAAEVTLNGVVDGDVKVVADKLFVGKGAVIKGSLEYKSVREAIVDKDATIMGETSFEKVSYSGENSNIFSFLWNSFFWVKLITLFVSAMILFAIGKRSVAVLSVRGREDVWHNIFAGILFLIGAPVSAVLLVMTVIGLPLSIAVVGLSIIFIIVSVAFTPILLGAFIKKLIKKNDTISWKVILLGSFGMTVLGLIPFLGSILRTFIFLVAIGVMIRVGFEKLQHIRN